MYSNDNINNSNGNEGEKIILAIIIMITIINNNIKVETNYLTFAPCSTQPEPSQPPPATPPATTTTTTTTQPQPATEGGGSCFSHAQYTKTRVPGLDYPWGVPVLSPQIAPYRAGGLSAAIKAKMNPYHAMWGLGRAFSLARRREIAVKGVFC